MNPFSRRLLLAVVLLILPPAASAAEDVYVVKRLSELKLLEGELPKDEAYQYFYEWQYPEASQHAAMLDDGGEIYLFRQGHPWSKPWPLPQVVIKTRAGRIARGRIAIRFVDRADHAPETKVLRFELPIPATSPPEAKRHFLEVRLDHFERLCTAGVPGGAWFREQARQTRRELGLPRVIGDNNRAADNWPQNRLGYDSTFEMFTGGQAISENLQLDRLLPVVRNEKETVPIDSLPGISVREFDWKALVKNLKPETDPLAAKIPFDQHVLLFNSFAAMTAVADEADYYGGTIAHCAEPRAEDANIRSRYERQLCLPMSAAARLLGPHLVHSVAVTGSDPYLRTGTDVAVLFEAANAMTLRTLIDGRVAAASEPYPAAKPVRGEVDGVAYAGMVSGNRVICSYAATLGDVVVVTNSLAQLKRLIGVEQKKIRPLSSLNEYTFFRNRYRRTDEAEQALLILSDATIRRWCGPQWRIANSRRTRAAAVLTEAQAENMDQIVFGNNKQVTNLKYRRLLDLKQLTFTSEGVSSSRYGRLGFQTPIIELPLTHASPLEADAYRQWSEGYQRNWSNYFDPIAVRFRLSQQKMAADVTVMPLILSSQYSSLAEITQGVRFSETAGDPHAGTMAHLALALSPDSKTLKWLGAMISTQEPSIKIDPLAWLGDSVAIYAEEDPVWTEVAKAERPEQHIQRHIDKMPIAVQFEVGNPLKLTLFLASVRAYVDRTSPGMTAWETREYRGQSYVRVSESPKARREGREGSDTSICYAPAGDALIVTFSEPLLKKAIDRRIQRLEAKEKGHAAAEPERKWLGGSLALHLGRPVVDMLDSMFGLDPFFGRPYRRQMQSLSWGNLPILNEWHRRYPKEDPVAVHERIWQTKLVCPGGGQYRWNEKWQTMESTVYGHPGEPKVGPKVPALLRTLDSADFGVTFEENGLRARAEINRVEPKPNGAKK